MGISVSFAILINRFSDPLLPRQVKAREEGVMPVEYQYSGSFPTETRVYPVINGRALMKPLKITCTNPVD